MASTATPTAARAMRICSRPARCSAVRARKVTRISQALANTQPRGAKYVRHFITNHVIEPAPGGAIGKEYAVIIDIGENGNPSGIALGGRYDDEYVKTPQGWKFKNRTFTPSRVDVQPPPAAGAGRGGRAQVAVVRDRETS